jgi:hypothetical protein
MNACPPRARKWKVAQILGVALGLALPAFGASESQNSPGADLAAKAAFLLKLTKYADWPSQALPAGAEIVIGVLGDDPIGAALDQAVQNRTINNHRLVVTRSARIGDLRNAQLVFVSSAERDYLAQCCRVLESWGALTVADFEQAQPYVAVDLALEGSKVVFVTNLDAAGRSHVHISSKLLHLSKAVYANGLKEGDRK